MEQLGLPNLNSDEESINERIAHTSRNHQSTPPSWRKQLVSEHELNWQFVRSIGEQVRFSLSDRVTYVHDDALNWLSALPRNSIHGIVTDPPFGLIEYDDQNLVKRRAGRGGVWRIPPSFDGAKRIPVPRFTVLSNVEMSGLYAFFNCIAEGALRALVPGGHVFVASNPLLSTMCFHAFQESGFEKRGEIIRQVQTLRGGDKPKGAEDEFPDVSVMPRSCFEPWGVFRKPLEGTAAANLRKWGTGGLRRISASEPFKDMILCSPTRSSERDISPHPSLKPQRFMRQIVRAVLPLGIGIVYDPFSGGGSTLAAAEAVGYHAIGTDRVLDYVLMGRDAFHKLSRMKV